MTSTVAGGDNRAIVMRSPLCAVFLVLAVAAAAQRPPDAPRLSFSLAQQQATLATAYARALTNVLDINTVAYDPARYNHTGLLAPAGKFLRAGGGYEQPWTRDASVNSWNAGSLLEPNVARDTLWAVVQRQANGKLIVQQDNQWWDQVIWIIAAWNHYALTGDRGFLANAYETASATLAVAKAKRFRSAYGLFAGPAFFNDGIAGYPVPPATHDEDRGSFVLDYPGTDEVMVLSTNCLYVQAYRSAAAMARERGDATNASQFASMADAVAKNINRYFWIPDQRTYGYLIHGTGALAGKLDEHQEGSGLAFAILFDIAGTRRARDVLRNAHIDPHGITDVYPHFPRYSDTRPGRHNEIVWPMVEGWWALAAAHARDQAAFAREVTNLAQLAHSSSGHFFEIYNAQTGAPDGGWQTGKHWDSEPDQTWSATAFVAMMFRGLFGMGFTSAGIEFRPLLPSGWGDVTLTGLRYRGAMLDIHLHGAGCKVTSFALDGNPQKRAFVTGALDGNHTVAITLHGGCAR